jgi:hypothetical protein
MSRSTHQRHDVGHDEQDREPTRRSDDVDVDHDASSDVSAHQRKAPTAGVRAHGGRWGDGEEMFDIKGRILSYHVVGDGSEIVIGAGRAQGVHVGMEAYLMAGDSYLSSVEIVSVGKSACRARVHATPDQIQEHTNDILINPGSRPSRSDVQNYKTRVIKVDFVGGKNRILVAGGHAQGVRPGMQGILFDEQGKKITSFTLEDVQARVSIATVSTAFDDINRSTSAVVNPT